MRSRALIIAALAAATVVSAAGQPATPPIDLQGLLARVAERVESYYQRAQSIVCTETMIFQVLTNSLADRQLRKLTYELRVSWDQADGDERPEPSVLRTLKTVGGKAPKDEEPRCLDPKPISLDPLTFLLPQHQAESTFIYKGIGKTRSGRSAAIIDYSPVSKAPTKFKWTDSCFSIDAPTRTKGRLWVDRFGGDILQIDETVAGPFDIEVPRDEARKSGVSSLSVDRIDISISYRLVTFTEPNEIVLLPESIEQMTTLRAGSTSRQQTTHTFTGYQRFVTGGRVVTP